LDGKCTNLADWTAKKKVRQSNTSEIDCGEIGSSGNIRKCVTLRPDKHYSTEINRDKLFSSEELEVKYSNIFANTESLIFRMNSGDGRNGHLLNYWPEVSLWFIS